MFYKALLIVGIVCIALGVLLAIASILSFYKNNMAEVYDALLDRGYVEKIEKRKNKSKKSSKEKKEKTVLKAQPSSPSIENKNVGVANNPAPPPSSDDTAVLNNNSNIVVNQVPNQMQNNRSDGMTTILNSNQNKDFVIIKDLYYASTSEIIK
jgi:hypothetical protein